LTVAPGVIDSYPNFAFDVTQAQIGDFVAALTGLGSEAEWLAFVDRFGVRRSDPRFWELIDAANAAQRAGETVESGVLDISRYIDPRRGAPDE
jgi:hypothetical protein